MPLVWISCRDPWYPTPAPARPAPGTPAATVLALGDALPALFTHDTDALRLDAGTPPEAVQVDYRRSHPRAVNHPDVWLLVVLTESGLALAERTGVRDRLRDRIVEWVADHAASRPVLTVDVFWGPGHGFMLDAAGRTTLDW
jgi:hypothetical protein